MYWAESGKLRLARIGIGQLSAAGIIPPKIALNCFDPQPTLKAANFQPSSSLISLLKVVWPLVVKITSYVTPAMMV